MELKTLLSEHKTVLAKMWFDSVVAQYPIETSRFLKSQPDRFANPVGTSLQKSVEGLLDEIVRGASRETVVELLDSILRVRAVQDFRPSQAIGFIFSLKNIIRSFILKNKSEFVNDPSLKALEDEIDVIALMAFDIYEKCRERLFDIKANQEKSKVYQAFKRAGLITEISDEGSGRSVSNV